MKKIAVFLPHSWRGGMFRAFRALIETLNMRTNSESDRYEIVLGVPIDEYSRDELSLLEFAGIKIRPLEWESVSGSDLQLLFGVEKKAIIPDVSFMRPRDCGGYDFLDCDAWIFNGLPKKEGVIFPLRPTAIFCPDLLQRVVPDGVSKAFHEIAWVINRDNLLTLRLANRVLCTTDGTYQDILDYAGVHPSKIAKVPMILEVNTTLIDLKKGNHYNSEFLWVTNSSIHKNHINAIKALETYYSKYGGTLNCVVCGPMTHYLDWEKTWRDRDHEYWASVRGFAEQQLSSSSKKRISFLGQLTDQEYFNRLSKSAFLWHNVLYDNGSFSLIEAAQLGVPVLSSEYPQSIEIANTFGLDLKFFPPRDPEKTALALKEMEDLLGELRRKVTFKMPENHAMDANRQYNLVIEQLLSADGKR